MDVLDGRAVVSLGNHELLPALDELDAEIIRLQGIRLQVIARVEDTGYAQELGARDSIELLAFRYRQDRAEAWRDVRLARALPKYAAVEAALTNGIESADGAVLPMRTAQAAPIVAELERVRSRVPVEDLDVAEEQLVSLAAHLAPKELRSAAKQLCDLLDSDGPEPKELKAYDREALTLTQAQNGVKFKGYLANENAELLRAVIHAGARPHKTVDGEHDPRPREKRQADALTTALTLAANAWDTGTRDTGTRDTGTSDANARDDGARDTGALDACTAAPDGPSNARVPGHGAKANITITIDLEDLKAATANAIGRTVYGDGLSAATIRRLACDANIIPLVLGSNSEPLDVGRQQRLVTKAMRRALNARDRGCVVCAAPPVMCDAHHLTAWFDGGGTAITNLALLCRRHHVDLHNGRWTITVTDGKPQVARPTWADPPPTPHNPPPRGGAPATPSARSVGDPCDGTTLSATSALRGRTSRWKANDATLAEAAHFAVRGFNTPTESAPGPPPFATI